MMIYLNIKEGPTIVVVMGWCHSEEDRHFRLVAEEALSTYSLEST